MDALLAEQDLRAPLLRYARQSQSHLLRKTRDPHLAVDLTQEGFLCLAEQRYKESIEHVDAYLCRTAHNLTIDRYRQEWRRRTETCLDDDLAGFVADQLGPEESAVDTGTFARLCEIVAELSPRAREIFRLNRLEGLIHAKVARRLEIFDSSVQKYLARALVPSLIYISEPTRPS